MPLPASIATDDILLLFVETENQAASISNQNGGTWAEVTLVSPQGTGTAGGPGGTRLTLFWSRYNGTQGNPTVADSGDHQRGAILAFRGCPTTGDPWDVGAGNVASSASTSVTVPGATTTGADRMCVFGVSNTTDSNTAQLSGGTWTNANLTGIANRVNVNSTTSNGGGLAVGHGVKTTAGAVGNTTGTLVTSSVQGRIMIALKPAAPAYTLACDAVSVGLTIAAMSPLAARLLSAAAVSVALTAADMSPLKGSVLTADPPAITATIADATLTYAPNVGYTLACEPVSISLTPATAGLTATRLLAVDPVSVAITASAADLLATRLLNADGVSVAITAAASGVLKGSKMLADPVAVVVTAANASLVYQPATGYVLAADPVAVSITVATASPLKGYALAQSPVSVAVSIPGATLVHTQPAPAVAVHRLTVSMPAPHRLSVAFNYRHGSSVMDTYRTSYDAKRTSNNHLRTSDAPMRYR